MPGAKYKLVVPPALALKPNSAKPPSVSTKSISPPSLCEICTRFCASTTAITFVNPAALIWPANVSASAMSAAVVTLTVTGDVLLAEAAVVSAIVNVYVAAAIPVDVTLELVITVAPIALLRYILKSAIGGVVPLTLTSANKESTVMFVPPPVGSKP